MTLTVEDGSIVAGADSYVTLDAYQTYALNRGWDTAETDVDDEVNLRRAFDAVNRNWHYAGYPADDDQVGAFPRAIIIGRSEYLIASDEIPQRVKDAQCELAHLIQGGLDPFATVAGVIKSAGAGPARVEFLGGKSTPRIVAVEGLLSRYLASARGQVPLVRG